MTGDGQRDQIDDMKKWIDVASVMGIQMVRSFGGWVPEGETEESVWPTDISATKEVAGIRTTASISATKEVAEYGASKGVKVGLHNHNHGCVRPSHRRTGHPHT